MPFISCAYMGTIANEPRIAEDKNGNRYCTFLLESEEYVKGNKYSDMIYCYLNGKYVDVIEKSFKKGDNILVGGKFSEKKSKAPDAQRTGMNMIYMVHHIYFIPAKRKENLDIQPDKEDAIE